MPRWRGDGRELFYMALNRTVMAITVGDAGENTFGIPVRLFNASVPEGVLTSGIDLYEPAPDGKQFFVIAEAGEASRDNPTIHVVINWPSAAPPTSGILRRPAANPTRPTHRNARCSTASAGGLHEARTFQPRCAWRLQRRRDAPDRSNQV